MSSVDPNNTYNGYYIKHLSDLEDELKADYRRAQQRNQEQTDELSAKYEDSIRRNNERSNDAVDQIRDDMQEKYDRSRESDRAELERSKSQYYDRFGRDRSHAADGYNERIDSAVRELEDERAMNEKKLQDVEHAADLRNEALSRQYQDKLDRTVDAQRESSQKTFDDLTQRQKGALDVQREEAARKYQQLDEARLQDATDNRRRTDQLITDNQRDMDNLEHHLNGTIDARLDNDHQAALEREEAAAQHLRDSQDLQSRDLRAQVRSLLSADRDIEKEKADARAGAVRQYEDEWRDRFKTATDARETELNKLRAAADEAEKRTSAADEARLRDRERYYSKLIASNAADARSQRNDITTQYEDALREAEVRDKRDRDYADQRLEKMLHASNEDHENTLKAEAENFQKSSAMQKQLDDEQLNQLQRQLEKKVTAYESTDISPAVENAVRRSIVKQYEKNLNTEIERNRNLVDSMQRNNSDRVQTLLDEHQAKLTSREQAHANELHQNQSVFVEHVADVESTKEEALRSSREAQDRELETLRRVFTQAQDKQRNEYETIIQNIKDDASTRIQASRQESEFALKQQQRAFSVQENEVIREYEKKLADQKLEYESRLDDIRNQTQQSIHDVERREKQNFDEQGRGYEQRIAEMEGQYKERERNITQNFEDQLDKVKRSNALLQSKKS